MSVNEVALKPHVILNDKALLVRPEALIGQDFFQDVDPRLEFLIEVPSLVRVWT